MKFDSGSYGYAVAFIGSIGMLPAAQSFNYSVEFTETEDVWRICSGSFVDLFCPSHQSKRSGDVYGGAFKYAGYNNHYFYTQVAGQNAKEYLSVVMGKEIGLEARILSSTCMQKYKYIDNRRVYLDEFEYNGEVLITSPELNNGKPFVLYMDYVGGNDDWRVDVILSLGATMQFKEASWEFKYLDDIDESFVRDVLAERVGIFWSDLSDIDARGYIEARRNTYMYDAFTKAFPVDTDDNGGIALCLAACALAFCVLAGLKRRSMQ